MDLILFMCYLKIHLEVMKMGDAIIDPSKYFLVLHKYLNKNVMIFLKCENIDFP